MTRLSHLAALLHETGCSCVIESKGTVRTFNQRGIADLLHLLQTEPDFLREADVADKVVGKGAAALLVLGKITALHAGIISRPALELLASHGIHVVHDEVVANIINRKGTGICPVEQRCLPLATAEDCLAAIKTFINEQNNTKTT